MWCLDIYFFYLVIISWLRVVPTWKRQGFNFKQTHYSLRLQEQKLLGRGISFRYNIFFAIVWMVNSHYITVMSPSVYVQQVHQKHFFSSFASSPCWNQSAFFSPFQVRDKVVLCVFYSPFVVQLYSVLCILLSNYGRQDIWFYV